ncbi:DUF2231 domain-containing protein [Nocardioides marmotae]|uniref:DUF2231 domain-containing protein n=1 Tax=Nocardioides marmotae TaxID=2663857 RepID=UPI0012B641A4|nr:DUF2231 domain-containing protein [Nocardioides marmotae]MBC9733231.1 hypothetical protein [Nocardioides marmotae]MTB84342.1 hypothetical protein [Nocardioides marmotae]
MDINGLPLHALVVHTAVVLGPVAALFGIAYAAVPRWRDWLRWPMAVLAVPAAAAVWVAFLSGEQLTEANQYGGPLAALVETHEERAAVFRVVVLAFAVVAVLAAALHRRVGATRWVLAVLLAGTGVATVVYAVLTGDAGAQVAWYGVQP